MTKKRRRKYQVFNGKGKMIFESYDKVKAVRLANKPGYRLRAGQARY